MKRLLSFSLCLLFACLNAQAQDVNTFDYDYFLKTLYANHPIAKQADLLTLRAERVEQKARGGFDPKVEVNTTSKSFEGTDYYQLTDGVLKVPTWLGLEVKGGYENNSGYYLNPENYVPAGGLLYAGVSLPIGQGLFIDERRADLRKAQIFRDLTVAERRNMINELVYNATLSYWSWFEDWNKVRVYENTVQVSRQRLTALKAQVQAGDLPAIDTVEAKLQLINLEVGLDGALFQEKKSRLYLSAFLWSSDGVPLEINPTTNAPAWRNQNATMVSMDSIKSNIEELTNSHPMLQVLNFQKQTFEIEKRFNQEMLKPKLNLNYYPLSSARELENISSNNYKWGLSFSMPIFLRKERANLQLTKLKIQDIEYKQQLKLIEIKNKVSASLLEYETTLSQSNKLRGAIEGYQTLLNAEKEMFDIGESSIFVVNSREMYLLNAQLKLIELISKNNKSLAELNYNLAVIEPEDNEE